jgi:GDSL-like Lipase/Acylhydrolase family
MKPIGAAITARLAGRGYSRMARLLVRVGVAGGLVFGAVVVAGNPGGAAVSAACYYSYGCGGGGSLTYFGLGDSYSSGESNAHYIAGSVLDRNSAADHCDRSSVSYPEILAGGQLAAITGASTNVQFIACSGATTTQMTTSGSNNEGSQVAQIVQIEKILGLPPDLMTLTGGGDDAGFSKVIDHCIVDELKFDYAYTFHLPRPNDCANDVKFTTETTNAIAALEPVLQQNYAALAEAGGPQTSVLVADYPQIFASSVAAQTCSELAYLLSPDDQSQMNLWGAILNREVAQAARADGLNFVDVAPTFKGHAVCDSKGAWIRTFSQKNGVRLPFTKGFGSASFHPNPAGQQGYATAFESYLRNYKAHRLPLTPAGLPADTGSFGSFSSNSIELNSFDTPLSPTLLTSSPDTATLTSDLLTVTPSDPTICAEQFNGGESVNVTGGGYAPEATVTLTIMDGTPWAVTDTVVADDSGQINTTLQLPAGLAGVSPPGVAPTGYMEADGAGASSTTESNVALFQVGDPASGCTETPLTPATATVLLSGSDGGFLPTAGAAFAISGPGLPTVGSGTPAPGTYAELDVAADESTVCPASEPAGVICSDGTLEGLTTGATYTASEVVTPAGYQSAPAQDFTAPTDGSTATVEFTNAVLIDNYSTGSGGQDCVLCVLAPSGAGAVSVSGTAKIVWSGPATVDSTSSAATTASGSATLSGDSFYAAGQVKLSGTATLTAPGGQLTGTAVDPFSWFTLPTVAGPATNLSVSGSTTATASPGVYSHISLSGSASLSLAPGTYVVTQGVTLSGSAKLTGSGVTIYLACTAYPTPCANQAGAGLSVSQTASVNISYGAVGPSSGFAILADPTNRATISTTGSGSVNLSGTLEAPNATLALSGSSLIVDGNGEVVIGKLSASGTGVTITAEGDQVPNPDLN